MKFNSEVIQNKMQPIVQKVGGNKYLQGISKGFLMALPAIIVGAFALILMIIPIAPYQEFLASINAKMYLAVPMKFTTNFVGVIYVFCIAYSLAKEFETNEGTSALLAIISFFILTPFDTETGQLITTWYGTQGIFSAIVIAILVVKMYHFFEKNNLTIRLPETVPPFVQRSFASLLPGIAIVSSFTIIAAIFANTSFGSFHQVIYTIIQTPLQGLSGGPIVAIFIAFLVQLVWVFGIHASAVMAVMIPIWQAMDLENLSAYQAGNPLPNIVTQQFMETYSAFTILPLALLLIFSAKSKQYKILGKVAIVPSLFNVSEPLLFGLPIVLNPLYAIPFLIYKPLCILVAYVCTAMELVPRVMGVTVPFGIPPIITGFMQGSWKIAFLQFLLILMGIALYYVFFKIADKQAYANEHAE